MKSLSIMQIICTAALAVLMLVAPAANANAVFQATLLGSNEAPPTGSPATGFATLTLTGDLLAVSLTFSGLIGGAATAGHIHCCTLPGTNTGVAVPLVGFPSATSGSYTNDFDLAALGTYSSDFVTANGGTAAGAEAALLAGLGAGEAYLNIHDTDFPAGEIRGFTTLVAVPEPGSLALLGLGMAGIALLRRRTTA